MNVLMVCTITLMPAMYRVYHCIVRIEHYTLVCLSV